jgi:AraC-like DNA-binding protein
MLLVNPNHPPARDGNVLLWGRALRYYVPSFAGPLSVKSVPTGQASWTTDEARHELRESSYLVVNDDHAYTIEVDSKEPVETFCVFFARGFVEAAVRAHEGDEEGLLNDPTFSPPASFREVLQSRDGPVGLALARLRDAVGAPRSRAVTAGVEDALVDLALALSAEREAATRLHRRVRAVKASTRDEIFRRLCVARDALEGTLDESLPLRELARVSSLSPFHLHRHFRRTFGETPQAYRTRQRLERAAATLRRSSKPVTEVALDAGFASLGSFSSLFKRRFGLSPLRYRLQKEQD